MSLLCCTGIKKIKNKIQGNIVSCKEMWSFVLTFLLPSTRAKSPQPPVEREDAEKGNEDVVRLNARECNIIPACETSYYWSYNSDPPCWCRWRSPPLRGGCWRYVWASAVLCSVSLAVVWLPTHPRRAERPGGLWGEGGESANESTLPAATRRWRFSWPESRLVCGWLVYTAR